MLDLTSLFNTVKINNSKKKELAMRNTHLSPSQINLTFGEPVCKLITRECLELVNETLTDDEVALMAAIPELFFLALFKLCGGASQKNGDALPSLMKEYANCFKDVSVPKTIIQDVKKNKINSMLICHGLCSLGDSILLVADIGRCCRIADLLHIAKQQVMLADLTWIRHNRSLNSVYQDYDDFNDLLRITTDKRSRLYASLGLEEVRFGISDYHMPFDCVSYTGILDLVTRLLNFAEAVWGTECRMPHDKLLKKKIGTSLETIAKNERLANNRSVKAMVAVHDSAASGLEETLSNELAILRTISDKFGVFDEDVLLYYLAQYCAQNRFENYVKIASSTERKFDQPFESLSERFYSMLKKIDPKLIDEKSDARKNNCQRQVYLPTYRLGQYEMLSYYALSKDVMKQNAADKISETTILMGLIGENSLPIILKVLKDTPTVHRNRLLSDLISFLYLLSRCCGLPKSMVSALHRFFTDEFSDCVDMIVSYDKIAKRISSVYANYLQTEGGSMTPAHFFPYLLEESDWDEERFKSAADIIEEILILVKRICE